MWGVSVWILMDPYGPVWVRMVPGDSLGASWGLLGPRASPKGGCRVFEGGGVVPPLGPIAGLGPLSLLRLYRFYRPLSK